MVVLERFFSRRERKKLFHSWAGSTSMWVKVHLRFYWSRIVGITNECCLA